MAKPASFNKRELEQRKENKRKKKQQKKDGRKSSTGSRSFEDMIAYVDENGLIVDSPPDTAQKNEIDATTIEVSVPKKVELEEDLIILKGRVEYFSASKGYGFIKDLNSTEKYFFHVKNTLYPVAEYDLVTFELIRGNKGMNANNIKVFKQ
ncbi:MAG: cold shock domain-containing protein [Dysgonamonadaceae bacterium]|jgi:cold shock CspA family protein|nr:cold shock domain-containing protein [Dysgonamonadaceae bacterium]